MAAVRRCSAYWALGLIGLFVALGTAITIPNVYHDQYRHFGEDFGNPDFRSSCNNAPQSLWLTGIGRPLAAEMECFVFEHATGIPALMNLRVGVLLVMAAALAFLGYSFFRITESDALSFLLALAIFVLPGAQNTLFMTNFPNALAPLLAVAAYLVLHASPGSRSGGGAMSMLRVISAGLLLLLSFLTYAALALFFLLPLMAEMLFGDQPFAALRGRIARSAIVFGASAGTYYLAAKWLFFPRDWSVVPDISYRMEFQVAGITDRIGRILGDMIPREFNLWNVYTERSVGAGLAAVSLLSLIAACFWPRSSGDGSATLDRVGRLAGVLGIFIVANSPWVIMPAPTFFRLMLVPSALALMLLAWSVRYWAGLAGLASMIQPRRLDAAIAVAFAVGGVAFACVTITRNAMNSHDELAYIRGVLGAGAQQPVDRVHLVLPGGELGFNGYPAVTGEFNELTTRLGYWWEYVPMVRLALRSLGRQDKFVVDGSSMFAGSPSCDGRMRIVPEAGNEVSLVDEGGQSIRAIVSGNSIAIAAQGLTGVVKPDGSEIDWSNGAAWIRTSRQAVDVAGDWQRRQSRQGYIYVTASKPGDAYCQSPNTIVIDMNAPLKGLAGD